MKLTLDQKVDILKTAILEDRTEIRLIKDRINSICTLVTVSSFAVTAFMLDKKSALPTGHAWQLFPFVDVSFLLLLWVLFIRLKISLGYATRCLEAREEMLRTVATDAKKPFDAFPPIDMTQKPRISENGFYWIIGAATLILLLKLITVVMMQ